MRAMTCRVQGNGSMYLDYGIRVSWDSDKRRHFVQLGGSSGKHRIQIPVIGDVQRGKSSTRATLQWTHVEECDPTAHKRSATKFRLISFDRDDDLSARRRGEPILVRIDLRMRVKESLGTGGWQSVRESGMGDPRNLATTRCANGQRGRRHLCFDGLLVMEFGHAVRIYPQGKHGMQFMLHYNEHGLQLIQTADFNQDRIRRFGKAREFARALKRGELVA